MSGLPSALAGKIVHNINFQPCVEATRLEIAFAPPLTPRFGFAGPIGVGKGQAAIVINITFAGVSGKQQFDLLALTASQQSGDLGFSYDFWEGDVGVSNHWLVSNCFMGDFRMSNDPSQGNTDKSIAITGLSAKKIQ